MSKLQMGHIKWAEIIFININEKRKYKKRKPNCIPINKKSQIV
jgi:hypothetical protein